MTFAPGRIEHLTGQQIIWKALAISQKRSDAELLLASNYDKVLQQECAKRNSGDAANQEKQTIRESIWRMWKCCQVVATDYSIRFRPTLYEPAAAKDVPEPMELGTGGRFPRKEIS